MFSRIPIFDILKTHQISEAKSLLSETQSLINQFNNELDDITKRKSLLLFQCSGVHKRCSPF